MFQKIKPGILTFFPELDILSQLLIKNRLNGHVRSSSEVLKKSDIGIFEFNFFFILRPFIEAILKNLGKNYLEIAVCHQKIKS